ncbi:hypothetical protein [Lysinibacillus fusiformis]|uniref:hypothetical protein n=1 Tax=Lysinibacillus fusiformis TaxID=28031 RepID=UPI003CEEAEF4
MKEQTSQYFVIFIAISFMIGSIFTDFVSSDRLLLSITLAALSFTLLDLSKLLGLNKLFNFLFLFLAVFSLIVIPYLDFLFELIHSQNNRLTIIGLSIVLLMIGIRQFIEEKKDLKQVNESIDSLTGMNQELLTKMEEQTKIIKDLSSQLKEHNK